MEYHRADMWKTNIHDHDMTLEKSAVKKCVKRHGFLEPIRNLLHALSKECLIFVVQAADMV